jgi:primosomal protein N' (replication factor Y)
MPQYCDVALPLPLDTVFTYRVNGHEPVVGGRVLVPFRTERLPGVVVALHDRDPSVKSPTVKIKDILQVLDAAPLLDDKLMQLGEWIARYYIAPLGEVLRTMLPLTAEVRRARQYRITDTGLAALHESATVGSSRRSQRSVEEQDKEYAVLDRLSDGPLLEASLRSGMRASRTLLDGMVRKKWIAREDVSGTRSAARTVRFVQLAGHPGQAEEKADHRGHEDSTEVTGASGQTSVPSVVGSSRVPVRKARPVNAKQQRALDILREAGGRTMWDELRANDVSAATIAQLAKRGLVALLDEPAGFHVSALRSKSADILLNQAQREALERIDKAAADGFSVSLLHGVTGSGKTAVYIAAMQHVMDSGRSALLLVPEIGLTPAAAAEVAEAFGDKVAILHSALSDDERAEQWHRIQRGEARVVVGTRSAVFAPVQDLALIVVDEEHDHSYKQEETPRYHARDVAVMRGKLAGAAVVLASATPSLESAWNAERKKYERIDLKERVEQRAMPEVEIVDMRSEFHETGEERDVSRKLFAEITERLARGEQTLILLNRRGYAPVVLCRSCGESVQCENCAISMTLHQRRARLECHYCGFTRAVPKTCPKCQSEYVQFLGTGSERLEQILHGMFPQARIARLDRDTVRSRMDFERVLAQLHAGELDILVGTQMIAKGHDIHGVTLVGILGADFALGFPDFRAAERTFQLLTQVAGRAGRGETPGRVILQTYFPDHYAVKFAAQHDFHGFYEKEIRFRRWMHYPPFTSVANVLVRSQDLDEAMRVTGALGKWFEKNPKKNVRVMGPAPAPIVRLKREYRYHFLLKSTSRNEVNSLLRSMLAHAAEQKLPRQCIVVDVDALSLL